MLYQFVDFEFEAVATFAQGPAPGNARHLEILDYAHSYYARNRVGPLFPNLARNVGASRDEIEGLFPNGIHSIYVWAGIPITTTATIAAVPTASIPSVNQTKTISTAPVATRSRRTRGIVR